MGGVRAAGLGAAIARRAAREPERGAGVESTSVDALLRVTAREPLPAGCVLVVDEAGMLPTRQLAELLAHVERAQGKLVLVGDHRQLPELKAGGAFLGLVRRGLAIELTENRRQVHAWEREALDRLRDGAVEPALAAYDRHGRIKIAATPDDARGRLVRDWWAAGDPDDAVMIAHRRVDVRARNAHARRVTRAAGGLGIEELELHRGAFAIGDRVVAKRNDARLDVRNGDRGVVVGVDLERSALGVDFDGRSVALPGQHLLNMTERGDPTLEQGYAITGHVAQGVTVGEAFVLAGEGMSGEWAYTAMSRGRERTMLYVSRETAAARAEFAPVPAGGLEPLDRLATAPRTSAARPLAIDTGRPADDAPGFEQQIAAVRAAAARAAGQRMHRHHNQEIER